MPSRSKIFRELLESQDVVASPGAWDALSARVLEKAGFKSLYLSGAGVSHTMLGLTDLGYMTQSELADCARRITAVTEAPLIVDIDDGFGNALNVRRTIRLCEQAEAAAIQIEDVAAPKRCAFMGEEGDVIPKEEMVGKIRAAVDARSDGLVIIARTDNYHGCDDLIDRAGAYLEAGADLILPVGLSEEDEKAFTEAVDGPLVGSRLGGSAHPLRSITEWRDHGYKLVIFPSSMYTQAYLAAKKAADALFESTTTSMSAAAEIESGLLEFKEVEMLLGLAEDVALQERFFV